VDARPASRWRSFRRGFGQHHPLVLVVAAAAVLVLAVGLPALVIGDLTVVDESRLLRNQHDDYLHVSYRVAQLRKAPPEGVPVYLFGGSGAMESFEDEEEFSRRLSRDAGVPAHFVSLAAHRQSFAHTLAIVDNLPPGPAVLAVGLTPMRFNVPPEDDAKLLSARPMLLRSPRLDSLGPAYFGEGPPVLGGLGGVFDFAATYLDARVGAEAGPGEPVDYLEHYYDAWDPPASPLAKRLHIDDELRLATSRYRLYGAYNLAMLEELLRLARDRGSLVVLYEQPLNVSAGGPTWGGIVTDYVPRVEALAAAYDVPYVHVQPRVGLRDADFADLYHLVGSGRDKWEPELSRQLAAPVRRVLADWLERPAAHPQRARPAAGRGGRGWPATTVSPDDSS
jgi:hypothetical protein